MSLTAVLTGVAIDVLVPILAKSGVPMLIEAIRSKSPLAALVIEKIAAALGVPPTPEAIAERYEVDPTGTAAVIKTVEAADPEMWRAIAEASRHVNETMRAEYGDKPLLLQRLWRPIFGFTFTFAFGGLMIAVVATILRGDVMTLNSLVGVSALLMSVMAMGAAVLGVYVWQRTQEKIDGSD